MANSSDARQDRPLTKRRTTLLLIAGALVGFLPRPSRSDAVPQKPTTIPPVVTAGSGFPDLKRLGPAHQVRMIGYRDATFRVTTADGQTSEFWEWDLRFKIDSSDAGPLRGVPVIVPTGRTGDRVWVFFAAPDEISNFIKDQG